jgi:FkbM family methyltransferase
MKNSTLLTKLLSALPEMKHDHIPNTPGYEFLAMAAAEALETLPLREVSGEFFSFDPIGKLSLPFYKMGAIDSTHLFGLDELIIFSFYLRNRKRYSRTADLGANLGLHSLILALLGVHVDSYEPDPVHFAVFSENIKRNALERFIKPHQAAISNESGTMEFVRVLGNTTSSHLSGAKSDAYGELERFPVQVVNIREVMKDRDFIKMDVEGQEAKIVLTTEKNDWARCEMILEIGTSENAELILEHCSRLGLRMFVQKKGWERVRALSDVPTSYRDGSAFITAQEVMIWG